MKERRYRDSYRLVTDVDPRTGRPREVAEYAGDWYRFPEVERARRQAMIAGSCVALYWALAIAHLRFSHVTSRCMYALVPFMLGLFPGTYAVMGLWTTLRAGERMTVVEKENGLGRLVRAALGCGVFAAMGAAGCAAYLTLGGQWAAGWPEPLRAAAAYAAAWAAFAVSRKQYKSIKKA